MVRWTDGLIGGAIAGALCAAFFAVLPSALHDPTLGSVFSEVAAGLLRGTPPPGAVLALALGLQTVASLAIGLGYAALARVFVTTRRAPGATLWGIAYGAAIWWTLAVVVVPLLHVDDVQPAWAGLAGFVLCYGIVLSECLSLAHRRLSAAPRLDPASREW